MQGDLELEPEGAGWIGAMRNMEPDLEPGFLVAESDAEIAERIEAMNARESAWLADCLGRRRGGAQPDVPGAGGKWIRRPAFQIRHGEP
jgi:hypothetical protein